MKESDIEDYLVRRVKELGGEVRKVKWIGRRSAPDRVVMLPPEWADPTALYPSRWGGAIWVEVKAPGKLATFPADARERAQDREHKRMRAMGQNVAVVDSYEGVEALLQ